jgi:hypothetical protein
MSDRRYRWSSLVIESATPLPELARTESARVDLRFECDRRGQPRRTARWSHQWTLPNGVRWLSIARVDGEHIFRFARLADFVVSADRRSIRCDAARTTSPDTIRHLLLDQVLPALTSGGRRFGVHASAVEIAGVAVAFLGASGRGKSTLAAVLGLCGAPIVTDDCLILDLSPAGVAAVPTYPSLRLSRETARGLGAAVSRAGRVAQYTSKLRLGHGSVAGVRFRHRPLPLGRLYLLERGRRSAAPRVVPLSRRQSYIELMKFSFRFDPRDPVALLEECDRLTRLAHAVPVARLRVPSDLAALADVRATILDDLRVARD